MQLLLILMMWATSSAHDLHLSMCSLTYNQEAERLEIQQRIFYDDLEKSLRSRLDDSNFDILNSLESNISYDSLFLAYTNDHLNLSINNKDSALSLLEYEFKDDALVLYLYVANVKELRSVKILSQILFEIYQDQDNVLSVTAYDQKKSERFSVGSKPLEITF